jgi:hypothetical protein
VNWLEDTGQRNWLRELSRGIDFNESEIERYEYYSFSLSQSNLCSDGNSCKIDK